MTYVESTLIPGETVAYVGTVSLWKHAGPIALAVIFTVMGLGFPPLLVVPAAIAAHVWIDVVTTEMAVTTNRVVYKTGLLMRKSVEIRLSKLESANVEQSVLGRMLGFGSVQLSGTGTNQAVMAGVKDPLLFRRMALQAASGH